MKKMMVCGLIAVGMGIGAMAFILNNKKTKNNATKLMNNAMKAASNKLESMK